MLPVAQKLIEDAQSGIRLSTQDRRHCVGYLIATRPDMTNREMGELFQVSERSIRVDKKKIRAKIALEIKEDDPALVIGDIMTNFRRQIRDLESSKAHCRQGTGIYLRHLESAVKLQLLVVGTLQDLGYLPKNLGNVTVEEFDWQAKVGEGGHVAMVHQVGHKVKQIKSNHEDVRGGPELEENGEEDSFIESDYEYVAEVANAKVQSKIRELPQAVGDSKREENPPLDAAVSSSVS